MVTHTFNTTGDTEFKFQMIHHDLYDNLVKMVDFDYPGLRFEYCCVRPWRTQNVMETQIFQKDHHSPLLSEIEFLVMYAYQESIMIGYSGSF